MKLKRTLAVIKVGIAAEGARGGRLHAHRAGGAPRSCYFVNWRFAAASSPLANRRISCKKRRPRPKPRAPCMLSVVLLELGSVAWLAHYHRAAAHPEPGSCLQASTPS